MPERTAASSEARMEALTGRMRVPGFRSIECRRSRSMRPIRERFTPER
jgi:hypothetical protein